MASTLLGSIDHRLPAELTLAVVQQLAHHRRALCALARTCRGFQALAEELLYRTIRLRSVRDLQRIIAAFVARPDRVRAVHTLKILYRWNAHLDVSLERRKAFNECVAQMVSLREWHIESPYDNFKWEQGGHEWVEGDMERFRQALERACSDGALETARFAADRHLSKTLRRTVGLAQLETLTIHSHGAHADFWHLDGFHCLFRHPSLRYLHVSCVTFPNTLDVLRPHAGTTPLTTLIFDECNLEPTSLQQLLATPRRLKHLTLGENVFNVNRTVGLSPRLSPDPAAALDAIAPVAHSLETLTHLDSKWRLNPDKHIITRRRVTGDGMRHFRALKTMECDTDSFLHEAVVMNPPLCPPNLDTLIVRRHFYVAENFFDYLPDAAIYTALPSLATLELRQSAASLNKLATADYICDPERLRNRHAYGFVLSQSDINFKVSIELGRGSSLIPPYLHGEPVPEVKCLYDAARTGFRRRITGSAVPHEPGQPPVLTPFHPFPHEPLSAGGPAAPTSTVDETLPQTDQLGDEDIRQLTNTTSRLLENMKSRFAMGWRLERVSSPAASDMSLPSTELDSDGFAEHPDEDDFDPLDEDGETDSDFEAMIQDLQNDGDEEAFLMFLANLQEQGVVIGEDEGSEEDDGDGEWHDAHEEGADTDWEDGEDELD
ncbi:hypothetical protein SVAN01_07966 [Stagonosporopsis vannaccii]|nr:hypothetical protein SVAN01_07966 [Stagonosporopsis vannaccii]